MMKFAPGQRWISDSESDLGLGTVVGIEGRMLTLLFPASGETRLYAIAEAPLTRVQFNPGDTIKSAEEFSLVVDTIEEKNQTLIYHGHRTDNGEAVSLRETFCWIKHLPTCLIPRRSRPRPSGATPYSPC